MARRERGFTLIELLVVIGLISVLAAGIGLSMRDGNSSSALKAGQNAIVGLLSAARGQAALTQSNAMIVVDVTDVAGDECLRSVQVVVQANDAGDQWRPVGEPILLPQGIYVVPPSGLAIPGVTLTGDGWNSQRSSTGLDTASVTLTERPYDPQDYPYQVTGAFDGRKYLKFKAFTPLGTIISGASGQNAFLVTTGKRNGPAEVSLDNSHMLRGVTVSRYGVPTLINEAETFDSIEP